MAQVYEVELPSGQLIEIESDVAPTDDMVRLALAHALPRKKISDTGFAGDDRRRLQGTAIGNGLNLEGWGHVIKASDDEFVVVPGPRQNNDDGSIAAGIRAAVAESPAAAAGAAAFGRTAQSTQGLRQSPLLPARIAGAGLPLVAAIGASAATSFGTRKGVGTLDPKLGEQLEADLQNHPTASLTGAVLANAPFFGIGRVAPKLTTELGRRAIPAAIGGGIQTGVEALGGFAEGSAERIAIASAGGALFNEPTKLGERLMGSINKNPVTSLLGNTSTKATITEANKAANEIAMAPIEPISSEPIDLAFRGPSGEDLTGLKMLEPAPRMQFAEPPAGELLADDLLRQLAIERAAPPPEVLPDVPVNRRAAIEHTLGIGEPGPASAEASVLAELSERLAQAEQAKQIEDLVQVELGDLLGVRRGRPAPRASETRLAEIESGRLEPFTPAEEKTSGVIPGKIPILEGNPRVEGLGEAPLPASPRAIELESPLFDSGISDARGNRVMVDRFGRAPGEVHGSPAPRETVRPQSAPEVEKVVKLGGSEYAKIGKEWVRATGETITDPTVISALEGRSSGVKKPVTEFIGEVENPDGTKTELWNAPEDIIDPEGNVVTVSESTVSRDALEKAGYDVPKLTPAIAKQAEERRAALQQSIDRAFQGFVDLPADPGPRDASISSGTGEPTAHEEAMMAAWREEIAKQMGSGASTMARGVRGSASPAAMANVSAPAVGAAIGYQFGDTPEEKRRNALIGASIASGGTIAATVAKSNPGLAKAVRDALSVRGNGVSGSSANAPEAPARPIAETPEAPMAASTAAPATAKVSSPPRDADIRAIAPEGTDVEKAESIYAELKRLSEAERIAPPPQEVASKIASAPTEYQPFLTDLAGRFPLLEKIPGGNVFSDSIGAMAKAAKVAIGTIEGNIRDVSPRTFGVLRQRVHDLNRLRAEFSSRFENFGKLARESLTKEEFNLLDAAVLSGDRARVEVILGQKPNARELLDAYDEALAVNQNIREMLIASGRDVGNVPNYFSRKLIDREGLLKALGKDGRSTFQDLVNNAKREKGRGLSADEEEQLLNTFISGSIRNAGRPGWLKPRTIETIEQNLLKYYEPFDVSGHDYIMSSTRDIVNRQYFGKAREHEIPGDFAENSNFGKVIREEARSQRLDATGQKIVFRNLQDYFQNSYRFDEDFSNMASKIRKFQTYMYLADLANAIPQYADFFHAWRKYGIGKALKGYAGREFKISDLNIIEGHNQDLADVSRSPSRSKGVISAVSGLYRGAMKRFLGAADEFNKGGIARSAWRWVSDVANSPDSEAFRRLNREYSQAFPERWPAMLKDLRSDEFRNGKLNDNTRFFLFNELANLQPLDASGRAQGYNRTSPWGKILYTLRSYAIKQLDILRNDAYNKLKTPGQFQEGMYNAITYLLLVGVGQQIVASYAKDKFLGRQTDPEEYAVTGLLQLGMIPRYTIFRAKQEGVGTALAETLIPGVGVFNDASKDIGLLGRVVTRQRDKRGNLTVRDAEDLFKQSRMIQYLPGFGREAYWWLGRGAEQEKRNEQNRLKGKDRPSTSDVILDFVSPPDLATERRN